MRKRKHIITLMSISLTLLFSLILCVFAAYGSTVGISAADFSIKNNTYSHLSDNGNYTVELNCNNSILPIIMYHSILNSKTGTYIVSVKQLEEDLKAYAAAGYTTVFPSEIIQYVKYGAPLPEKPILISFDDGYFNNYYYAKKIFEERNLKAIISPVGIYTDRTELYHETLSPNYSFLPWKYMKELYEGGHFEFGNHTYNMHNMSPRYGIGQLYNESDEAYVQNLKKDAVQMHNNLLNLGINPVVFAYPFGKYSTLALNTLKELGYEMFFTCNEGVNLIQKNDMSKMDYMKRINRSGAYSTEQLMKIINKYTDKLTKK